MLLPDEEQVVITKEVYVIRVVSGAEQGWSPFYLHWALCLKSVRKQWQRVALMQTNREDVAHRYREILIPLPRDCAWAVEKAAPFSDYFTTLAGARSRFLGSPGESGFEYIATAQSVGGIGVPASGNEEAADHGKRM